MSQIPAILLTGFLGAGKTTLLNEILHYCKAKDIKTALVINEFGQINIDSQLIDEEHGAIYEVNQGSIFCVCTRDQFIKAISEIVSFEPPFDLVLLEATGIAETSDLGEHINSPPLKGKLKIMHNLCIIDALNFHKVLHTLPAVKNQVEEATLCIVNKIDLVSEEQLDGLEEKINKINPGARIIRTEFGKIDISSLIFPTDKVWHGKSDIKKDKPKAIYNYNLESSGVFSRACLERFLKDQESGLLRGKGFIRLENGVYYIQWMGNGWTFEFTNKRNDATSQLVLIGDKCDEERLNEDFSSCIIKGHNGR